MHIASISSNVSVHLHRCYLKILLADVSYKALVSSEDQKHL